MRGGDCPPDTTSLPVSCGAHISERTLPQWDRAYIQQRRGAPVIRRMSCRLHRHAALLYWMLPWPLRHIYAVPATTQAIRIAPRRSAHRQSKVRKQFNVLVQKLETERVKLAHWRDELPAIRAVAENELLPLAQALSDCMRQMLFQYHRDWSNKALSRPDRDTLSECICELARDFL